MKTTQSQRSARSEFAANEDMAQRARLATAMHIGKAFATVRAPCQPKARSVAFPFLTSESYHVHKTPDMRK